MFVVSVIEALDLRSVGRKLPGKGYCRKVPCKLGMFGACLDTCDIDGIMAAA